MRTIVFPMPRLTNPSFGLLPWDALGGAGDDVAELTLGRLYDQLPRVLLDLSDFAFLIGLASALYILLPSSRRSG